jgi:sulfur-oxidizing protein SoxY
VNLGRRHSLRGALALTGLAALPWQARADEDFDGDPLRTMTWGDMRREFLGSQPVVFDERVKVEGPGFAVDPMTVPITVSVDGLSDIRRIVVMVDRNPIRKVLEFEPLDALPTVSFRFKLEQASPVRAAVLAGDGRWHVGHTLVDSAGGGCTVPGATRKDGSWSQTLMQARGRLFLRPEVGGTRLRLHLMHPMDTGLVGGIPAFYLSKLEVRDAADHPLLRLQTFEPISENPVFSFDFRNRPAGPLRIQGRDNNGNRLDAAISA